MEIKEYDWKTLVLTREFVFQALFKIWIEPKGDFNILFLATKLGNQHFAV